VKIDAGNSAERIGALSRSAISVATPHHGTPLTNFFLTIQGQTLLLVLSGLASSAQDEDRLSLRRRRWRWWPVSMTGSVATRAAGPCRGRTAAQMKFDRRDAVWKYLREIERDACFN
jgi:hypothetical protein